MYIARKRFEIRVRIFRKMPKQNCAALPKVIENPLYSVR